MKLKSGGLRSVWTLPFNVISDVIPSQPSPSFSPEKDGDAGGAGGVRRRIKFSPEKDVAIIRGYYHGAAAAARRRRRRAIKLDSLSKETTPLNHLFGGYLKTQGRSCCAVTARTASARRRPPLNHLFGGYLKTQGRSCCAVTARTASASCGGATISCRPTSGQATSRR